MRNINGNVPRLSNPNFGSVNIRPGSGSDPNFARNVAENRRAHRRVVLNQMQELTPRYELARQTILALRPKEEVPSFSQAPHPEADEIALEIAFNENEKLVLALEARAEELERERIANLSETEKLRREVDDLRGLVRAALARISVLEGRSPQTSVTTREAKASAPMVVPAGGMPGLGGVSASFAGSPAAGGGGVRRVGSKPG